MLLLLEKHSPFPSKMNNCICVLAQGPMKFNGVAESYTSTACPSNEKL